MAVIPNPFNAQLPITKSGDLADAMFIQGLNAVVNGLLDQIAGLQQTVIQLQTAQSLAAQAQAAANNPTAPATTNGSASASSLFIDVGTWTHGPQVNLTGVAAGTLTANLSMGPDATGSAALVGGGPPGANPTSAGGLFRIVEIESGSETTVYQDAFTASQYVYVPPPGVPAPTVMVMALAWDAAALAVWSAARVSLGAISYRLDLQLTSPLGAQVQDATAYLYVNRA